MNKIDVARHHPVLQVELDTFYRDLEQLDKVPPDKRFTIANRLNSQAGTIRIRAGSRFSGLPDDFRDKLAELFDVTACKLEQGNTDVGIARIASHMRERAMIISGIPPPAIVFAQVPKTPAASSRLL